MLIVLFGKKISFKIPEQIYDVRGNIVNIVTLTGSILGLMVFNNDNVCFMKQRNDGIYVPLDIIKY